MVQKTYHFTNLDELDKIAQTVYADPNYQNALGVLVQIYNPRMDIDEERMVEKVNQCFPCACVSGLTNANIAGTVYDTSNFPVDISFTYFHDTVLAQFEFDLNDTTSFVAGRIMNEDLESISQLRCLQILYCTKSSSINAFLNEFHHHSIPIFGAKAGRNITKANTAHVYGRKVYEHGIVVIALLSDSLSIYMDSNLGWQPIGVDMTITQVQGDNVAIQIDNEPAVNIYSKYLKVEPNEYFVQNVCEFPLIIDRNHLNVARVPSAYDASGGLHFTSDVYPGEQFRLAYANLDNLYTLSKESVNDLSEFEPEAVYIFECGNRMRFLKEYFQTEIELYKECSKDLSVATCYAELFITPDGKGCDLNSTLVAIGLKESVDNQNKIILNRKPSSTNSVSTAREEIPFVERILAFLESTSQELNARNKELRKIAYTDQLTKIYNRRELELELEGALVQHREGIPFGILFFDIDHFKHVNDTYGHDVGDMVLVAVVNRIRQLVEPGHVFGRWGGEEFIYLIPRADEKMLREFAEKVRKSIDEICFLIVKHITISVGATLARTDDTPESFVKRADEAVYEAKETGRNKVVLY
ncbi:MAG: diguanylate cyclase [Lachnospiraceae bacterium]|nr:diguanylate cyclase [Lachnospiraceae bacterium]